MRRAGWRHPSSLIATASFAAAIVAVTALSAGCPGNGKGIVDETLGGGDGDGTAFAPTLAAIQKNVFGRVCINCHFAGGPGPMPLTSEQVSYDNLVNVPSIEVALLRVAPGDPDHSYILEKLMGSPDIIGDRMPPPPERKLTRAEIESISEWIVTGAQP